MEDKKILCAFIGCDTEFIHSVRDQEFYLKNKYVDPKYCKFHREQRKADAEKRKFQEAESSKMPLNDYLNQNQATDTI